MNTSRLATEINELFSIETVSSSEFDGISGGLMVTNSDSTIDGVRVFEMDSATIDPQERTWTMGVVNDLYRYLQESGHYVEFIPTDGTVLIY